jgi:BirA family biotin operon repressor/biotin-[acetyl-CoA-carboxylase] ligase
VPADVAAGPAPIAADSYDGQSRDALAARVGVPHLALYARIGSTMDAAHELGAAGAPTGALVLADEQTSGRGRQGSSWHSAAGKGVWLTLLERPRGLAGLEVLSLRVGLAAAAALDAFSDESVEVKWPNDLLIRGAKLAGVLVEVRWRGARPDWVAIGLGVNVVAPRAVPGAAGLRTGTSRVDVLEAIVPALRRTAAPTGPLDARELQLFAARDYARGRRCVRPAPGVVAGVTAAGELAVETPAGVRHFRAGSLLLQEGV